MANQERNTEATDDAIMSSSSGYSLYLPMDIIFDILNRLPVKSLLRFRCVCKTFRQLISNPTFISSHLLHHRTPTTAATIVTFKHRTTTFLSLLESPSSSQNPNNLVHPFPNHTRDLHLIGSINGLLCLCLSLSHHPLHSNPRIILLWNPATKHFKSLPPPTIQIPPWFFHLSLGFGFRFPLHSTSSATDYKVVRIVSFKLQTRVEVYSAISDCWREIQVMDLRFYIHKLSCEVIVSGAPYWLLSTPSNQCLCFTWFDVQNEAFVLLPGLNFPGFYTSVHWKLMDWKDNAAVVVCCPGNPCVDVWMIEDRCGGESNWCKKFVIGPVLGVEQFWLLQCMKNGEIIAEDAQGRIFLYNPQSGETKYIPIDGVQFEAFHYVESLVSIKGFKQ